MIRPKLADQTAFSRATLLAVVAITAATAIAISSAATPAASGTTSGGTVQFTVKDTLASFNVVDSNGHGWTPGDSTTFTHVLRDMQGAKVGRADGNCVITRVKQGHPTAAECGETYRFADGWIQTNTVDLIKAREDIPITGGIGRYQHATGEAKTGLVCADCITFQLAIS
jgi:hypothetical protein